MKLGPWLELAINSQKWNLGLKSVHILGYLVLVIKLISRMLGPVCIWTRSVYDYCYYLYLDQLDRQKLPSCLCLHCSDYYRVTMFFIYLLCIWLNCLCMSFVLFFPSCMFVFAHSFLRPFYIIRTWILLCEMSAISCTSEKWDFGQMSSAWPPNTLG